MSKTATDNAVNLMWNQNGENYLRQYIIYMNGVQIGTSTSLIFIDNTVLPDSTYTYMITAQNIHENISGQSNTAVITVAIATINIKVMPEGFYNISTQKLNMSDSLKAYLHSNFSPFNLVDSASAKSGFSYFYRLIQIYKFCERKVLYSYETQEFN